MKHLLLLTALLAALCSLLLTSSGMSSPANPWPPGLELTTEAPRAPRGAEADAPLAPPTRVAVTVAEELEAEDASEAQPPPPLASDWLRAGREYRSLLNARLNGPDQPRRRANVGFLLLAERAQVDLRAMEAQRLRELFDAYRAIEGRMHREVADVQSAGGGPVATPTDPAQDLILVEAIVERSRQEMQRLAEGYR